MKQTIEKFNTIDNKKKKGIITWVYTIGSVIILSILKILGLINLSWFFILTAIIWIPVSIIAFVTIVGLIFLLIIGAIGGLSERRRNSKSK